MLKKWIALLLLVHWGPLLAQIYECADDKGARLWTNQPCANGVVLHEGVGRAAQREAEQFDRGQRAHRAKESAAAAERFRKNAYESPRRASERVNSKSLQRCDASRRSLRIELSKTAADRERVRQLRSDERKYC